MLAMSPEVKRDSMEAATDFASELPIAHPQSSSAQAGKMYVPPERERFVINLVLFSIHGNTHYLWPFEYLLTMSHRFQRSRLAARLRAQ